MAELVWLIPAFPLAGFLLILLFGRRLGEPFAGVLASAMVLASFVVSVGGVSAPVAIAGAVVATVVEMLPIPLDDNLGITLAAGYTMRLMS